MSNLRRQFQLRGEARVRRQLVPPEAARGRAVASNDKDIVTCPRVHAELRRDCADYCARAALNLRGAPWQRALQR